MPENAESRVRLQPARWLAAIFSVHCSKHGNGLRRFKVIARHAISTTWTYFELLPRVCKNGTQATISHSSTPRTSEVHISGVAAITLQTIPTLNQ